MKTVRISKRRLLFAVLAVAALVGVALVVLDIEASSGDDEAGGAIDGPPRAGITLMEADVEASIAAAGHALGEIMRLDHAEGREAWQARIEPLCTENGLLFWAGPLFAEQVWPEVLEQSLVTQAVEVVEAKAVGASDSDGIVVKVVLEVEYTVEGSQSIQKEVTNSVVMICRDGLWLVDGPSRLASSEAGGER